MEQTYKDMSKSVSNAFREYEQYQSATTESEALLRALQSDISEAQEKLGLYRRSVPDNPGKRSFWSKDTITISKEDYDALRAQASVGQAIDERTREFKAREHSLDQAERKVREEHSTAYKEGRQQGYESLWRERGELDDERKKLAQREKAFADKQRDAYIGKHAQEQGLISKEDLAMLEIEWQQSKELSWLKQLQDREHRSLHHGQSIR